MQYERILFAFTVDTFPSRFYSTDRLPSPHYMTYLRQAVQISMPENIEDIYLKKTGTELVEARDIVAMEILDEQETTHQINQLLETGDIPYLTIIHERRGTVFN